MSVSAETQLAATPASPGVAIGPAIVFGARTVVVPDMADPATAFTDACSAVSSQLEAMCEAARTSGS